jgi:hypothetical protein
MAFVLLAPAILPRQILSEPATVFLPNLHSSAEHRMESPPPRLSLTA